MGLSFFDKMAERFRKPPSVDLSPVLTVEEPVIDTASIEKEPTEKDIPPELENKAENSIHVEQIRRLLLRNEKVIGKPFNSRSPEIRIYYVDNFVGAFIFFLRLCDQRLLTYKQISDHLYCTAVFPDGSGNLSFTDKIKCRDKAVIAILKVEVADLKSKICEIRFKVKHKT